MKDKDYYVIRKRERERKKEICYWILYSKKFIYSKIEQYVKLNSNQVG